MPIRPLTVVLLGLGMLMPAPARAQGGFGLGGRMSWVRGDLPSGSSSSRFLGATMRISASKRVALEVAIDRRTEHTVDGLARLREVPIQGSLLLYPVRATFAPYLLGGFGWYRRTAEQLDASGTVTSSFSTRESGAHFGLGAEVFVGRHASIFGDYRFRFVSFGEEEGAEAINLPFVPGLSKLNLSHRGSMWTTGMAIYF